MMKFLKQGLAAALAVFFLSPVISSKAYEGETVSGNDAGIYYYEAEEAYALPNAQSGGTYNFGDYVYFGAVADNVVSQNEGVEEILAGKTRGFYDVDGRRYWVGQSGSIYNCIPLRWMVIADEGNTLLLLQDYALKGHLWDTDADGTNLTWENSEIRTYLNSNDYLDTYFTSDEQSDIVVSTVTNTAVGNSSTPIADTYDMLYLPSAGEITTWFSDNDSRRAHYFTFSVPDVTTPITGWGDTNAYNKADFTCAYWTRTPGRLSYGMLQPTIVSSEGAVGSYSRVYSTWSMGLRPLMRIAKDSIHYYQTSENIGMEFECEGDVLETYPMERYQIPVRVTGIDADSAHIMAIRGKLYSDSTVVSTINDDLTVDVSVGSYIIKCSLYGVVSEPITAEIRLNVKPAIETVTVKSNSVNNTLDITWSNPRQSPGYEISRSASENGEYDVIYSGAKSGLKAEGDSLCYTDTDVEAGQTYWYKVRGLIFANGEYKDSYNGMQSEYSAPVSGCLSADGGEPALTEGRLPDAVLYVPYEFNFANIGDGQSAVGYSIVEGNLPEGMRLEPDGKLCGVPMERGEFVFSVEQTSGGSEIRTEYTLTILDNTDANAEAFTNAGYEIVQRVPDFTVDSISSHTLVSVGTYDEYTDVYIDGVKLVEGEDYTSESGSTRITIKSETFARFSEPGVHTIVLEFRTTRTNDLKRAVQNYYVAGDDSDEDDDTDDDNDYNRTFDEEALSNNIGTVIYHTVQAGETLSKIAVKYYGSASFWRKIYTDNRDVIKTSDKIYAGQRLLIYLQQNTVSTDTPLPSGTQGLFYKVHKGDSLWSIAVKSYGKGRLWQKIYDANTDFIKNPDRIHIGQSIFIP